MQSTLFSKKVIIFVLIVVALSVSGVLVRAENGPETLNIQLGWTYDYSSSPLFMAEANGYFEDAGIEVTLSEGGFQDGAYVNSLKTLLDGESQIAATDSYGVLKARANGEPIVAIATLTQRSPMALISLSEDGIRRPQDLVGKTVAVTQGTSLTMIEELLADQNIDPDDVNIVPRVGFDIEPLLNGDVDVLGGWIINEGQAVRDAGFEPNFILFSDYGFETYVSLYVTTEDMIANHPDAITGFVEAYVRGLQAVVDDPDQAIEQVIARNEALEYDDQYNRIQIFLPLINPPGGRLGMMSSEIFEFDQDLLLDAEILIEPIDVSEAFNLTFLNAVYSE